MRRGRDDAVVVVTGASSGIGRATARAFAGQGAAVVLVARREDVLETVAKECEQRGGSAMVAAVDVSDADALAEVAEDTVDTFGRLDVWVNNAAVNLYGRLEEVPYSDIRRVLDVNLLGYVNGARAAIPWFREQGTGVLVNVSSVLGRTPSPLQAAYVATKHGIVGLSGALRQELLDVDDIHVCAVLPGPVDTPLFQRAANYTGWQPVPLQPTVPAEVVADAILRVSRRPRPEMAVAIENRATVGLYRLAPRLVERLAAVLISEEHFVPEHAAPSAGNVHEPVHDPYDVDGGWGGRKATLAKRAGIAGVVAVLGVAGTWAVLRRDRAA